jgi:hypothetical protein
VPDEHQNIFIHGLREFCRNYKEDKLDHTNLSKVATGMLKQYKGHKCEYWKENCNAEEK